MRFILIIWTLSGPGTVGVVDTEEGCHAHGQRLHELNGSAYICSPEHGDYPLTLEDLL